MPITYKYSEYGTFTMSPAVIWLFKSNSFGYPPIHIENPLIVRYAPINEVPTIITYLKNLRAIITPIRAPTMINVHKTAVELDIK